MIRDYQLSYFRNGNFFTKNLKRSFACCYALTLTMTSVVADVEGNWLPFVIGEIGYFFMKFTNSGPFPYSLRLSHLPTFFFNCTQLSLDEKDVLLY